MALAFVNAASTDLSTIATSHSITVPSGVQAGDLLILAAGKGNSTGAFAALTGWTQILATENATSQEACLYYRIATASEDAGDTITVSIGATSQTCALALLAFRGVDSVTPFVNGVVAIHGTASTSHTIDASAVSPAGNAVAVFLNALRVPGSSITNTPPTGYTEVVDEPAAHQGTSWEGAYKFVSAGALGSLTSTSTSSVLSITFALAFNAVPVLAITGAGGIASAEAFGTPTITVGPVTITPSGIASAQAFGAPTVTAIGTISPSAIPSSEAFGTPTVSSLVALAPAGIASAEAFGTPTIASFVVLAPAGIVSAEAFGTPAIAVGTVVIAPAGIDTAEAFGLPTVTVEGAFVPLVYIPPSVGTLEWEITTLHYPDQDAVVLAHLTDVQDGLVTIPRNDQRTAQVALSVYDPALGLVLKRWQQFLTALAWSGRVRVIEAYAMQLRARYRGHPVFWGPITLPEWRGADAALTLHAVDPSLRLQHQYLVSGDLGGEISISSPNGKLEVSSAGYQALRDAAMNLPGQTARGVPDIGIVDGVDAGALTDPPLTVGVTRGDELWSTWLQSITSSEYGPDFELEPIFDIPGVYARLNTYASQGTDKRTKVAFHYGFGADNLADFVWTPGGSIITHVHSLDSDLKAPVEFADLDSSRLRGIYVEWHAAPFKAKHDALAAYAKEQVKKYGVPPDYVTVTLRPDTQADGERTLRYPEDFGLGDTVQAIAKRGYMNEAIDATIREIRLRQIDASGIVTPEIDLLPVVGGEPVEESS
jgi:hypothetical protein